METMCCLDTIADGAHRIPSVSRDLVHTKTRSRLLLPIWASNTSLLYSPIVTKIQPPKQVTINAFDPIQ